MSSNINSINYISSNLVLFSPKYINLMNSKIDITSDPTQLYTGVILAEGMRKLRAIEVVLPSADSAVWKAWCGSSTARCSRPPGLIRGTTVATTGTRIWTAPSAARASRPDSCNTSGCQINCQMLEIVVDVKVKDLYRI